MLRAVMGMKKVFSRLGPDFVSIPASDTNASTGNWIWQHGKDW
jgi:hypothetical protein